MTEPGAAPGRRTWAPWLLVASAVAIMVLRQPLYLTQPSFYAEEGSIYFFEAWNFPWYRALLAAPAGYFLLFTNVATLAAARLVPLRHAPMVTVLLALAVQTAPIALIAFSAAPGWRPFSRKVLGVSIVLFASLHGEIWLNTINSQCYFALLAVLILMEPADVSRARAFVHGALLAIACLSGPVAAALAPLFVWKAWLTGRRAAWGLGWISVLGALTQASVVLATGGGRYFGSRGGGASLESVAVLTWARGIILPVFGPDAGNAFVHALVSPAGNEATFWWTGGAALALVAGAVLVVAWLAKSLTREHRIALAGSFVLVLAVVLSLASSGHRSLLESVDRAPRYFYVPGVIFLLLLLENAPDELGKRLSARQVISGFLLACGIGLGIARYRQSLTSPEPWPLWTSEVRMWEQDPHHKVLIWPPPWKIFYLVQWRDEVPRAKPPRLKIPRKMPRKIPRHSRGAVPSHDGTDSGSANGP